MTKWNRQTVKGELLKLQGELGRIPRIKDCPTLYTTAYKLYGSWGNAIEEVFGRSAQDEQYESVLSGETMKMIQSGEITSRSELFRFLGGRNNALRKYLDRHGILVPNKWTKEQFHNAMIDYKKRTGQLPKAGDDETLGRLARRFYSGWNQALRSVFGVVNQNRYSHLSDDTLLGLITGFVKKYQRLPAREDFDGSTDDLPYWETIVQRFGLKRWSEVYLLVNLDGIQYFHDKKHGTGKVIIHDGVVFLSRQEYLIGKYLSDQGIRFEKEVPYAEGSAFLFDFYLIDFNVYIEYYGMETPEYKQRVKEKRAQYNGRTVVEIFKHENTVGRIALEVQRLQLLPA